MSAKKSSTTDETKTPKPAAKKAPAKTAPAKAGKSVEPKAAESKAAASNAAAHKGEPTHEEIAKLAHRYWEERGHHHGSHVADWIRAERELRGE